MHSGTKGEDDGSDFATFFPEFLWILRDFALMLKDANGRSMSPKEYGARLASSLPNHCLLTLPAGISKPVSHLKKAQAKQSSRRIACVVFCPDFSRRVTA